MEGFFISSITGAKLFADHRLVTDGPYRIVRHPMYLGFAVAACGALLLYRTWAILFIKIQASPTPYQFKPGSSADEEEVTQLFEAVIPTGDLEGYLSQAGTCAFIVAQDDRLLYEHYFNGCQRDSLLPSHSVTKSVVSALVGRAILEGKIQSIEDPITRYLAELASPDARFSEITTAGSTNSKRCTGACRLAPLTLPGSLGCSF